MPVPPEMILQAANGLNWPAITATGIWTALFTAFGVWLKQRAPMKRVQVEADSSLRRDLMKLLDDQHAQHTSEVAQLKAEQAAERLRCAEDMAQLRREAHEDRARLEGEIKALRDQLLQLHQSTGNAIQLGGFDAPETRASMARGERTMRQRRRSSNP